MPNEYDASHIDTRMVESAYIAEYANSGELYVVLRVKDVGHNAPLSTMIVPMSACIVHFDSDSWTHEQPDAKAKRVKKNAQHPSEAQSAAKEIAN